MNDNLKIIIKKVGLIKMKFNEYYNLMVTFSSLDDEKNGVNFTEGIVKYLEKVQWFVEVIRCIEETTKLKATEFVKPSFKSSEIFKDTKNEKYTKFDIVRLQFPEKNQKENIDKVTKTINELFKGELKIKLNKQNMVLLYLIKEPERKLPLYEHGKSEPSTSE